MRPASQYERILIRALQRHSIIDAAGETGMGSSLCGI